MDDKRSHAGLVAALMAGALLVLLSAYVGGYFLLGTVEARQVTSGSVGSQIQWGYKFRIYNSGALAWVFQPMATIESRVTGEDVGAIHLPP
jgi:hypothetical protein